MFLQLSCRCYGLDCESDNYSGEFRIIDSTGQTDLIFGHNPRYDKNNIKFISIESGDTTFYKWISQKSGVDSIIQVKFYPQTANPILVMLDISDIDTMQVNYKTRETQCCGTITDIESFKYNNTEGIPGRKGIIIILK